MGRVPQTAFRAIRQQWEPNDHQIDLRSRQYVPFVLPRSRTAEQFVAVSIILKAGHIF